MAINLREAMARTICRAGICGPGDHLDEQERIHWRKYEMEANAVLNLIEPTLRRALEALEQCHSELESVHAYYGDKHHARLHSSGLSLGDASISELKQLLGGDDE